MAKEIVIAINKDLLVAIMLIFLVVLVGINQYLIFSINSAIARVPIRGRVITPEEMAPTETTNIAKQIYEEVVPKEGEQTDYGITFSTDGMNTLVGYYRSIELTGEERDRFIKIGTQPDTSCEYCCGIGDGPAITEDGRARCGCAHHLALIGLIKYLVKQGYTDQQILNEIQRWKAYFFPQGYVSEVLQERGISPESAGLPVQRGGC